MKKPPRSNRLVVLPDDVREQLLALNARYRQLLAMLPTNPDALADLADEDSVAFNNQLADYEMIATEMRALTDAQLKILAALERD